jgi:hypothetical protein
MTPQQAIQILASVAGRPMSEGERYAAQEAVRVLESAIAPKTAA